MEKLNTYSDYLDRVNSYQEGFKLYLECQQEIEELESRINETIKIIENDTTLNPERQRKRLVNILKGGKNE